MTKPLGLHILLDVAGAPFAALDDLQGIEKLLVDTVDRMGATVLGIHMHRLAPQGVSGVVVIAESHLTIHTWPELGEAAVDLFTCGDAGHARLAMAALADALGGTRRRIAEWERGAAGS